MLYSSSHFFQDVRSQRPKQARHDATALYLPSFSPGPLGFWNDELNEGVFLDKSAHKEREEQEYKWWHRTIPFCRIPPAPEITLLRKAEVNVKPCKS